MSFLEQAKTGLGKAGGFIFGAGTETPTYESLKKRREVAELLAQQAVGATPQNFGEGIASVGRALAYKLMDKRLAPQEAEMGEQSRSRLMEIAGLLGRGGGAVGGYSGTPPSVSAMNGPAAPAPVQTSGAAPGGFTLSQGAGNFQELFPQVEQQFRLPEGYLSRVAQIESGGDPNAKNPNSSATGLFQFIKTTADQYGVDPTDPVSSTVGAGKLAADNAAALQQALGRPPTAGELYLAHQQGAGGAIKLLTNPDAPAASIVGADAVNLNGGNANMSARDFAGLWMGKIDGGSGISSSPFGGGGIGFDPALMSELADLAGNEYLKPGERMVAQALIQRMMDQPEGMTAYQQAQLGMDADRLALDRARFEREAQPKPPSPTDDMQEYEFAKSQGYQGTFTDYQAEMKKAGASSQTVTLAPGESEYDKSRGKFSADSLNAIETDEKAARAANSALAAAEEAMSQPGFYSGSGGQAVLIAKRAAQAMGLDPEGVDSAEAFNALASRAVLDSIGGSLGAQVSNSDREFIERQAINLGNSPEGNRAIITIQRRLNDRKIEVAKMAREYERKNGRLDAGFNDELAAWAEQNPLFSESDPIFGAAQTAPGAMPDWLLQSDVTTWTDEQMLEAERLWGLQK